MRTAWQPVGRNLPLAVLLRDADLHAQLRTAPGDVDGLWRSAAAATIVNWCSEVIGILRSRWVLALDVAPERLTAGVVSSYLKMKAKHLLGGACCSTLARAGGAFPRSARGPPDAVGGT